MLTHIVRRTFRMARPTNFKLGTRMEDDDPHQPQAPQRSRSQGHVISLTVLTQCHTCVIRGQRRHTVSAEPGGYTSCFKHFTKVHVLETEDFNVDSVHRELLILDKICWSYLKM